MSGQTEENVLKVNDQLEENLRNILQNLLTPEYLLRHQTYAYTSFLKQDIPGIQQTLQIFFS